MAAVTKPDRFVDQIDADRAALNFVESVAKTCSAEIPGVEICAFSLVRAAGLESDGRVWLVWGHSGQALLASAVVVRTATNYSLLFTRVFRPTALEVDPTTEKLLALAAKSSWRAAALTHLGGLRDRMTPSEVATIQRFLAEEQ